MNSLEQKVIAWAHERGLIAGTTTEKQCLKLVEEVGELSRALLHQDRHNAMDGIGDCLVVLTNMAHKLGTTLEECFEMAYDQIKFRKGKMVNGTFKKDGP